MAEIESKTREEKLWNGEDIEPVTREEMYIKHIFDKTQTIPDHPITRKEMLMEKAGEGGGGDITIKQLTATENRTYSEEGTAYSPVIVNVPDVPPVLDELTVTENGTYTPPSGTDGYDEVTVSVPLPPNAYLLKEIEDVAIASFNDGADLPMPKLEVAIEPQQDLHGYDAPWVGGAGKNKLPSISQTQTINGVTWTLQSDGSIKLSGTATANSVYDFGRSDNLTLKSGSYFANENGTNYTVTIFRVVGGSASAYKSGGGAFSVSEDTEIFMRITVPSGATINETLYPMIESGTTATSYAPYSNECPISGWDEVNVGVSGKNLFGEINPDKWINADGDLISYDNSMVSQLLVAKANKQYVLSSSNPTSTLCICFYDKDMNKMLRVAQASVGQITATAPVGSSFMYAGSFSSHNNLQLEFGSTPTEYTPYTDSHTYTIDLDGTRYGGTLDVISGALTLTHGYIASYNGETLPSTWISDRDVYVEGTTPTIGAEVCYELATPQTIQLTPTMVKSLLGANNVWADTGNILDGNYFAKEASA